MLEEIVWNLWKKIYKFKFKKKIIIFSEVVFGNTKVLMKTYYFAVVHDNIWFGSESTNTKHFNNKNCWNYFTIFPHHFVHLKWFNFMINVNLKFDLQLSFLITISHRSLICYLLFVDVDHSKLHFEKQNNILNDRYKEFVFV